MFTPLITRARRLVDKIELALIEAYAVTDLDDDPAAPRLRLNKAVGDEFWTWTIAAPGVVLACGTGVDYDDALTKGLRILGTLRSPAAAA